MSFVLKEFITEMYSYGIFPLDLGLIMIIIDAISTKHRLPWGYIFKLLLPYLLIYAAPLRRFFLLNSGVEISLEDYTCFISPLLVRPTHLARSLPSILDWPIRQQ
jgi:hypothetical protein